MRIEWGVAKSDLNRVRRGKGFDEAALLLHGTYRPQASTRNGKRRWEVWGYLDDQEWLGVFEFLYDGTVRVISLRRANARERARYYGQESQG